MTVRNSVTTEDVETGSLCVSASEKESKAQMSTLAEPGTGPDENNPTQKPRFAVFHTDRDADLELGQIPSTESAVVARGVRDVPPANEQRSRPLWRRLADRMGLKNRDDDELKFAFWKVLKVGVVVWGISITIIGAKHVFAVMAISCNLILLALWDEPPDPIFDSEELQCQ